MDGNKPSFIVIKSASTIPNQKLGIDTNKELIKKDILLIIPLGFSPADIPRGKDITKEKIKAKPASCNVNGNLSSIKSDTSAISTSILAVKSPP